MTQSKSAQPVSMTMVHAMRRALMLWFVLVVISAFSLGVAFVLVTTSSQPQTVPPPSDPWFIASALMLGLVVPACVVAHWRMFRSHWRQGVVEPGGYLRASAILWGGLTLTAIVIAIGVVQRNTLMPDLTLAGPTIALLLLSWPSGWSMTHATPRRYEDDAEILHFQGPGA
ncbi:hypothetical protein HED60_03695 [Planctomycetales bacterium ZRK34]|nr:hypothetical protein HED60_03695 [Planctomycetales bacterium ZRK34]